MKFSLLKQKLLQYHQNKGWAKKSQIIPDHDEVVWLDVYLKKLNQDQNISDDSDVYFEDFKKFIEQHGAKKDLFSSDYLNSSNMSAALFTEWQRKDILETSLIKYVPPLSAPINILSLQLNFDSRKYLTQLLQYSHPVIDMNNAESQVKNKYLDLFRTLPNTLESFNLEKIFFEKNSAQIDIKLKATSNYHNGTLFILGEQILIRIKLYTKAQLDSPNLQILCIEMGKVFINFITQRSKEVPKNILNILKMQIERHISKDSTTSSLFNKEIPDIPDEFIVDYIQFKINQNPCEPLAILLHAAEEINPSGIEDTLEHLMHEFLVKKTSGKKIALMLIRRLNEADDKLHVAVPQKINQPSKP